MGETPWASRGSEAAAAVPGVNVNPDARRIVSRPTLFTRISGARRVAQISAPAGSGKTLLLRSWIESTRIDDRAAWVSVQHGQRDPQRFWIALLDALRGTRPGAAIVGPLTSAPDVDCWAVVERLLKDLGALEEQLWLVVDDLQELRSEDALRQFELFLVRAPSVLRFVLVTRHDLRLGLHRLRLEGAVTDIRAADLRFTVDEARELFEEAGVRLSDSALALLHSRTEGWAAGLRLAALSLAGHEDAEGFAAEFSGSERTIAEYLLAEVLERQPENVRRLLLRTSVLERVSGPLADTLTGGTDGEHVLQELERANAFVVALDSRRSWFRYHQLFADLLRLELRRTAANEVATLHVAAANWFAQHEDFLDAIRHAIAARAWGLAARILSDQWFGLELDGRGATAHELLGAFPAETVAADAQLAVLKTADELNRGSLDEAATYLALATRTFESAPEDRRNWLQLAICSLRLLLARQRGDFPTVVDAAQRLMSAASDPDSTLFGSAGDIRTMALINLGIAEWSVRGQSAERYLEEGVALARSLSRPFPQVIGLSHLAIAANHRSLALASECGMQAIDVARRQGWSQDPIVAPAYAALGLAKLFQGRLEEAGAWLDQAAAAIHAEVHPAAGVILYVARGTLQLVRGDQRQALASYRIGERLAGLLLAANPLPRPTRARVLQALVRAGELEQAEAALASISEDERGSGDLRIAQAELRLAGGDPRGARDALAPVLDGSAELVFPIVWSIDAWLLAAVARNASGDAEGAARAVERALDLAEPQGVLLPFLLYPVVQFLEPHAGRRTAHAALIRDVLDVSGGRQRKSPPAAASLIDALSESEIRVLRYLPTNLSAAEIANELCLSVNTIKTHMQHVYGKLAVHSRAEAVEHARALGLLAPAYRTRDSS